MPGNLRDHPHLPRTGFLNALQNGGKVTDGDPLRHQRLQHALHAADGDLRGDQLCHQLLLLAGQVVEQLLRLGERQQFRHGLLDDFGEMRGEHARRVHHGAAAQRGFLAQRGVDPQRGQAEGGLGRAFAGYIRHATRRVHGQEPQWLEFSAPGFDLLDPYAVGLGR